MTKSEIIYLRTGFGDIGVEKTGLQKNQNELAPLQWTTNVGA